MRFRVFAALGLGSVAVLGLVLASSAAGSYTATFDGAPASPQPVAASLQDFDVQVHSRDVDTWFSLESIAAQHGADCSAPPATHVNTAYNGSVFQCKDHLMTALNTSGYGVIYLTPNRLLDFSNGGSITFEQSTERMSSRDWWDILITPYAENLALPLLSDLSQGVDLQGPPRNTIHIGTDNGEGSPVLTIIRNGVEQAYQSGAQVQPENANIPAGVNQSATRQTFKFTVGGGRMKFERLASATGPAVVFWDVAASVPFTSGIVQFGHHSYNPTKDGAGVPGTRHWDNISLDPATPFTMIKADRRFTQGGTVNFSSTAPSNAYLRFAAICKVRINGQLVDRMPTTARSGFGYTPDHQSSYFVPISQGAQSVNVSFEDDGFWSTGLGCIAKDFSVWSLAGSGDGSTATPTRTATPANTPGSGTPTATPSATPTASVQASIRGTVLLEGVGAVSGVNVSASPGGASVKTLADGSFTLTGLAANQAYTVTASSPGFLNAARAGLRVTTGTANLPQVTLKAGDVNGDGAITIIDVSIVSSNYDLPAGPSGGDLNRNGRVDIVDVSLVSTNFDLTGPTAW